MRSWRKKGLPGLSMQIAAHTAATGTARTAQTPAEKQMSNALLTKR